MGLCTRKTNWARSTSNTKNDLLYHLSIRTSSHRDVGDKILQLIYFLWCECRVWSRRRSHELYENFEPSLLKRSGSFTVQTEARRLPRTRRQTRCLAPGFWTEMEMSCRTRNYEFLQTANFLTSNLYHPQTERGMEYSTQWDKRVVLYECETWSLTLREECRLRVSIIGCWIWYLCLRGTRQQGSGEDYITRNFILSTHSGG